MAVSDELIAAIHQRSKEGKLDWTEFSAGGFIAQVGDSAITIDHGRGAIILRITNETRTVIDSDSSLDRSDRLIEEIYEMARKKALRIDETLSNLRKTLEEL